MAWGASTTSGGDAPEARLREIALRHDGDAEATAAFAARERGAIAQQIAQAEAAFIAKAPQVSDFGAAQAEAEAALRQALGRLAYDIDRARRRALSAADDLARFRDGHGLARNAHYPPSRLFQAGLLFCALAFEAAFSAALFAGEDARGLLGGAATAAGLSGANVMLGFLAGYLGLRYLQHRGLWRRIAGGAALALLSALGLGLNLWAAQWRERLALGAAGDRTIEAAGGGFDSVLPFSEPQALVLLMLGGGVWAFAALKGYSGFDDPYPDYGKLARAADDAADDLDEMREDARAELEEIVDGAQARWRAQGAAHESALRAYEAAYEDTVRQVGRLVQLDDAWAAASMALTGASAPTTETLRDAGARCGAALTQARAALRAAQAGQGAAAHALQDALAAAQARLDEGAAA